MNEIALAATPEEADTIAERHEMIVQQVPALISWERFAEIQQRLISMGGAQRGRPPLERLPLQGRVKCSIHGLSYTPERSTSSGHPGSIHGECTARRGINARKYGPCREVPRIPWIEDTRRSRSLVSLVSEAVERALRSPEAITRAVGDSMAQITHEIDQLESATSGIGEEIDRLREKKGRLALLWADGDVPDAVWQEEKARLDKRIAEVERKAQSAASELQRLASLKQTREVMQSGFSMTALTGDAGLVYGNDLSEIAVKLDLRVIVEPDCVRIEGLIPLGDVPPSGGQPREKVGVIRFTSRISHSPVC